MGSYPETSIPIHSGSWWQEGGGEGVQKRQLCHCLPQSKIRKQMILYVKQCISFTQRILYETSRRAKSENVNILPWHFCHCE